MSDKIIEALKRLDPANEAHWTADGLPKVEALGIEGVKRPDVTKAAPHFKRDNLAIDTPAVQAEKAKPAPATMTLEDLRKQAEAEAAVTLDVLNKARKAHDNAVSKLDGIIRQIEIIDGKRSEQAVIMDYLASQAKRREQKAAQG